MLRKLFVAALLALAVLALPAPAVHAESELDFTLANATGYGIAEVYIAPSKSDNWGSNILQESLENGESVAIQFHPSAAAVNDWDIMIVWVDGGENVYWRHAKLKNITKITLKYNRASGETSAISE